MSSPISRIEHPNLYMLAALMFVLFADPFIPGELMGFGLSQLGIILVLATSLLNVATHRFQVSVGLVMLGVILAMRFGQILSGGTNYESAYLILVLCFLLYITILMTRDVFTTRNVTLDTISEALSVYMLMGLTWGIAYRLLEVMEPGSFNFPKEVLPDEVSSIQRLLSFSYVTLTTLGYGNITPASPKSDALSTAEAIIGQIYITVLVARLVALQIQHGNDDPPTAAP